jgi:quercetin dioxygenase-like cupin family protein
LQNGSDYDEQSIVVDFHVSDMRHSDGSGTTGNVPHVEGSAGSSGKDLIITVEYPPGGADPIHKHNAHGFIYVLEGTVVMQVKGGKQVTLTPGQTWYEGPEDVHVVGRNASSTKPAKFLVFLVKEKGAPVLVPVK